MPRTWLALAWALVCTVVALAEEPIAVGLSLPLTGPAATYGTDILNIVRFADSKLGQNRFRFIVEDDRCDSKEAVSIAHKFINIDKVKYVIGIPCSGNVIATAPVYQAAHVVVISSLAAAPKIQDLGPYIFSARPNDVASIAVLTGLLAKRHTSVGIIAEETDWAVGVANEFTKSAEARKLQVQQENFLTGSSDLRSQILRLKAKQSASVVAIAQTEVSSAFVIRQIREQHWDVPFYTFLFPASKTYLKLVGNASEGVTFAMLTPPEESLNPEGRELYQEYLQRHGEMHSIPYVFWCAFESYNALRQALAAGGDTNVYLHSHTFNGVMGSYRFNSNGIIEGKDFGYTVRRVVKGRIELVKE